MIDNLHVKDPLGHSDHCVMEFQLKCYFEQCNIREERWNYFKGNYEQMNTKLDLDWGKILIDINLIYSIYMRKNSIKLNLNVYLKLSVKFITRQKCITMYH